MWPRFANAAAITWTRRALGLLGDAEPARRFDLLSSLEKIADTLGDRSVQDALNAEMAALLERHPDDARQAEFLFTLAMLAERRDDGAASEQLSREALALAERSGAARWAAMSLANLAWLQFVRLGHAGARSYIDASLMWAERIEEMGHRVETRAQGLIVSAMLSTEQNRFDEALQTLRGVLALGQDTGLARLQLGALDGLAKAAHELGRWDEAAAWSEQAASLARSIGAAPGVVLAESHLGRATMARGDHAAAIALHERLLAGLRDDASPSLRAAVLHRLGMSHMEMGDVAAARPLFDRAAQIYRTIADPIAARVSDAFVALCEARLGRPAEALLMVEAMLERPGGDLTTRPADDPIGLRWTCQQVLAALGDERAGPLLEQLHADVPVTAVERTDAADRDRLIQAIPSFRDIVAAYGLRGAAP